MEVEDIIKKYLNSKNTKDDNYFLSEFKCLTKPERCMLFDLCQYYMDKDKQILMMRFIINELIR